MNWAKDAAEAIIDDDAVLAEEDARRRRRNAMLTIGALAGGVGLGAGIYANRQGISDWWNKHVASPSTGNGVAKTVADNLGIPGTGAAAYLAASTRTASKLPLIGPLINKFKGRLGLGSDTGVEGIRGRLADLKAPENKGWSRQTDTGAPLREFTEAGSPSAGGVTPREGIDSLLRHYQENKISPAGTPISHLRQVERVVGAAVPARPRMMSAQAHEPMKIIAALKHVSANPAAHASLLEQIANIARPGAENHAAVVDELAEAMKRHQAMPGRNATGRNALLGMGATAAIPWAFGQLRGLVGAN